MVTTKHVSIVLPVYNGEEMLEKALDSIFAQTYTNFELIVVDDGSTDSTKDIIEKHPFYKDARFRYIEKLKNEGLPAALNTGFAESMGDYLTWTSHDNVYHPRAIGKMVQVLSNNKKKHLVYTGYTQQNLNDDGSVAAEYEATPTKDGQIQYLIESANVNYVGACFMYTRHYYETVGNYNPEYFRAEDLDYWLRGILALGEDAFIGIPKDLYTYTRHDKCLSADEISCGEMAIRVITDLLPQIEAKCKPETKLAVSFMGMCTAAYRCPIPQILDFFKLKVTKYQEEAKNERRK